MKQNRFDRLNSEATKLLCNKSIVSFSGQFFLRMYGGHKGDAIHIKKQ